MAKFKKGDRVKLCKTDNATGQLHLGMLGTVVEIGGPPAGLVVEWDGFDGGHSGLYEDMRKSCWAVREEILELYKKDPWEAALASHEFYFTSPIPNGPVYKMKRLNTRTFLCTKADEEYARGAEWHIRGVRECSKYWTLVDNPNKQEKTNVDNLYQKIAAKQKQLRGLIHRRADLHAQAIEIAASIVKEERQLAELKHELLSALKKELGS